MAAVKFTPRPTTKQLAALKHAAAGHGAPALQQTGQCPPAAPSGNPAPIMLAIDVWAGLAQTSASWQ